jgi:HAD superfamily hydrolase (TIGR01459 family)
MWGVLHDGHTPYPGVLETISQLRKAGKELVILSNSSKRQDNAVNMLQKLGFDPNDFAQIITSGEVTFQMMQGKLSSGGFLPENKKVCVLGSGDGDVEYCERAGWQVVPVEEAALLLARGTFTVNDGSVEIHKRKNEDAYHQALQETFTKAAQRKLPMMVANPDKVRPDFERPPMPGKLGDDYARFLKSRSEEDSLIKRIGKPFSDVYELALRHSSVDLKRVVMVGDALETDITGGNTVGCHSLWVLKDGIHSPDLSSDESFEEGATTILKSFNKNSANTYARGKRIQPQMIMEHFVW